MIWTHHRIKQLEQLQRLLNQASSLNSGSNVIERMKEVIMLAKALSNSDRAHGRNSFIQFLINESYKEDDVWKKKSESK